MNLPTCRRRRQQLSHLQVLQATLQALEPVQVSMASTFEKHLSLKCVVIQVQCQARYLAVVLSRKLPDTLPQVRVVHRQGFQGQWINAALMGSVVLSQRRLNLFAALDYSCLRGAAILCQ